MKHGVSILTSFHRDSYNCPKCNTKLSYLFNGTVKGRMFMFNFDEFPFKLSGKTIDYICPKCKYKFQAPIEEVLKF